MLKKLDIIEGEQAKYYRGILIDCHITKDNNYVIETEETEVLHMHNGYVRSHKCNHAISRFIIPKRRLRLIEDIKSINTGRKIVVKLLYERRSGKFAVSSIGLA